MACACSPLKHRDMTAKVKCQWWYGPFLYYAALLPRRGPHIASHSRTLSVRLSVCPSVCPSVPLSSVTWRHLANYNDALRAAYRTAISAAQTCYVMVLSVRLSVRPSIRAHNTHQLNALKSSNLVKTVDLKPATDIRTFWQKGQRSRSFKPVEM